MSLKKNIVANYFGQGWQALMGIAFVPLYIKYLGMESYGLIGIFAILQAWLVLLDMGMKPALGREMARFTGGAHNAQSIRDLLRSVELIGAAVAGTITLCIWAASGWAATHWVTEKHLRVEAVAHAFAAMGLVTALRFMQDIYVSCCIGLQRQVEQNVVTGITSTVRGIGAVALLAWVSPTIEAFFLWQALLSVITVAIFAGIVYRALPPAPQPARFSVPALVNIWRFAGGIVTITLLSLLLTQIDKILLSRLLTLEMFGYYALAGVVAGALTTIAGPISSALYPRFTELVTSGEESTLGAIYHQGAQMVTVLVGSAAMVLMVFGYRVLRLWTGNPSLAERVAPLVVFMALGTLLNGLLLIPYQMQLAQGWTSLTIKVDIVAVSLFVPAVLLTVPTYGGMGAVRVWALLNLAVLILEIPLMHRRLLPNEMWRWCSQDVIAPLAAAAATAFLCRWVMPHNMGKLGEVAVLLTTSVSVLIAAAAAAPVVRNQFTRFVRWHRPALRHALPEFSATKETYERH
jgi:O-antigen/teichoic acid export membrane protein